MLCLEDRIVLVSEASGSNCSPHRVFANCSYPKNGNSSLPADMQNFALKPVQLLKHQPLFIGINLFDHRP